MSLRCHRSSSRILDSHVQQVLLIAVLTLASEVSAQPDRGERFENRTAGIALTRPPGCHTVSLESMQKNREKVRLHPEPHPTLNPSIQITLRPLGGLPAAHARATYTLTTDAGQFKVRTRIWVVTRGPFMFLIGMSGPADGPDVSETEFTTALASIQIEK